MEGSWLRAALSFVNCYWSRDLVCVCSEEVPRAGRYQKTLEDLVRTADFLPLCLSGIFKKKKTSLMRWNVNTESIESSALLDICTVEGFLNFFFRNCVHFSYKFWNLKSLLWLYYDLNPENWLDKHKHELTWKRFCNILNINNFSFFPRFFDTSKQAIGALFIHFANVFLSTLTKEDPCSLWVPVSVNVDGDQAELQLIVLF